VFETEATNEVLRRRGLSSEQTDSAGDEEFSSTCRRSNDRIFSMGEVSARRGVRLDGVAASEMSKEDTSEGVAVPSAEEVDMSDGVRPRRGRRAIAIH